MFSGRSFTGDEDHKHAVDHGGAGLSCQHVEQGSNLSCRYACSGDVAYDLRVLLVANIYA